ncbi:LysR family transcriptional regulator [Stenotrophomonas maltophilia]|nr:LysR family transcriptional regulator [Stenotrophomonas maltophilia]
MTKSEPSPHPSLLLERTTRRLSLTEEGADFYGSCVRVLAELDEAEARAASRRREVAGTLRISLPVSLGRRWVMSPSLNLAKQHSQLHLEVRFSDRVVDLLEEGIDMVVRLGEPGNSAFLASRCLGHQRVVTCASPAYLADRGLLACVSDLAAHDCLTFASAGGVLPWTLPEGSAGTTSLLIDGRHTISDGEALRSAVLDGAGIAQLPTWLVADELRSGALVAVLAAPGYTSDPDTGYVAVDKQSRAENPGDRG